MYKLDPSFLLSASRQYPEQVLSAVAEPLVQNVSSAQSLAVGSVQSAHTAPPVDHWVPVHASQVTPSAFTVEPSAQTAQVLSTVVLPAVHALRASVQSLAAGCVQATQASLLLAECWPVPHSTQVLSVEAEPVVQKDPSLQVL
jgi:hypothetical protein